MAKDRSTSGSVPHEAARKRAAKPALTVDAHEAAALRLAGYRVVAGVADKNAAADLKRYRKFVAESK